MTTRNHIGDPSDVPTNTVVFHHDWTAREELVGKVVSAVADATGRDVTSVERVHDRLDPESLNGLFNRRTADRDATDARLTFRLDGCTVTVHGSGLVVVEG
jgi:hypothetical protein